MFDKFLENLNIDEIAGKFGLPADQVQSLVDSVTANMGQGSDMMAALMQAAQQHGMSAEKMQEMLGSITGNSGDLLGKLGSMFGGDTSGIAGLADAAKGFFGKD